MKTKLILISILVLALLLRLLALDMFPFGFTPDEASFGYDAFSILKTGKDQWGHALPLVLESFGDFKLPLYSYLTIPSVIFFGLNKFSVRLPNAVLGSLSVITTFFMVKELLFISLKSKTSGNRRWIDLTSLLSALFLSISPWHIMMSRGAFEANLTTFLMSFGVWLFLKGFKNENFFVSSLFIFGLNLFSYHSARLVTPIIVVFLFIIFWKEIRSVNKKKLFGSVMTFLTFLAIAFYTLSIGGTARAKDVSIFSGSLEEASEDRFIAIYQGINPFIARLIHNKYTVTFKRFTTNYSQYFSFRFLFFDGPAEATYGMIPGIGVLYLIELPLLMAYIYKFIKDGNKKPLSFFTLWILVAPIPAALAQGQGYAGNRAVIMLPALSILSAIGAVHIYKIISESLKEKGRKIVVWTFFLILGFSFLNFFEKYFYLSPYKESKKMLYGNLEAATWLSENVDDEENVIVSRSLSEPHIYIAFANHWNPSDYQKNTKNWENYRDENLKFLDQLGEYSLGNYAFKSINYNEDQRLFNTYLVGRPDEFSETVDLSASFISPSGEPYIYITKPIKEVYAAKTN